jgi:tRNA 2-thiocytidine biosynthesis protein TtcA
MNSAQRLRRKMGEALGDFGMIDPGDRILVAVSGGKDSLSLLDLLRAHAARAPVPYSLLAVHVDLGSCQSKVGVLRHYFEKQGYAYRIVETQLGQDICGADDLPESCCFHCARIRRKLIFDTARELGCVKLAFGHHLDDMIETCLLNMFFAGNISTMLPRQPLFRGRLVLIRPLAYCREQWMGDYARERALPVRAEACEEGGARSRRRRIKELLAQLERENPGLKGTLFRSLMNVRTDYLPQPPGAGRSDASAVGADHVE